MVKELSTKTASADDSPRTKLTAPCFHRKNARVKCQSRAILAPELLRQLGANFTHVTCCCVLAVASWLGPAPDPSTSRRRGRPKLMAAPRFRHQVTEMGTRPRSCWWDQPSPCGRLFQRVRRSRGIERRMTRPSGFQSREISPPRPAIVVRTRRSPNPLLPVGDTTAGPPRSVQMTTKVSPWFAHWIRIRPAVAESAPYLVAFVANSLSSNARLEITDPEISTSHPVTENLEG
jgi:hypothetical protein